ncbi:hypothetical protein T552_01084 [Pneumocystis carinii B80]|uniref:Uncharacterized protein n=1 Tax=Pneumocystis carinii (strain B80) TaxID=1408658 RepID=A0A0W4ZNB6_PNEC8|nr:hypothetical protein T552_01084 [Pneumocystis carinii B80]KTW29880.1 hypothetical protein T552_01084 [Pneumocystis carinii B80]
MGRELDGSCCLFGWLKGFYQRMKDRQMEKKFRAGMKYSEYVVHTENGMECTSKKAEHVSDIVVYRYREKDDIQDDEKRETLYREETSLPAEKKTEMRVLSNNTLTEFQLLETDQLSSGINAFSEAKSTDPSSHFVSCAASDDTASLVHLSNNKNVYDQCRISMDTNASICALAPSRQLSYSSLSSAWTGSRVGLSFVSEATTTVH